MTHIQSFSLPSTLKKMDSFFERAGFDAYLVGGAVRDMLMGKPASDWDVATNATPEQVMSVFKKVIPTGIEHGTVTVIFQGEHIEVTTFRTEADYSDGRHPDNVEYAATIEEDLSRRDFTMNAIAVNLRDGTVADPFNGRADINKKIIRCVGDPLERFSEDGLRPVRALRFAAQLGFGIERETFEAIPKRLDVTEKIAAERFHDELLKMLKSPVPSIGLRLMEETGIMKIFLPELLACRGVEQKGFHNYDVLDHLYYSCDGTDRNNPNVRLAALFHDIGKPKVRATGKDGVYTFYQHEAASAKIAQKILDRLHFSRQTTTYVCHLIAQHMFFYEPNWTDSAVRRFLVRIKYSEYEHVLEDLFDLRRGDLFGMNRIKAPAEQLIAFQKHIEAVLVKDNALTLKDLAVNGRDLMAEGIPAGKHLGIVLNELFETVLDDPAMNTKEKLLIVAKNYYDSKLKN
ncbi:MAG: HD domain-containing protein [Spirochaetaceae bacterium]|nr:HD domain-containing protein [Spirochaetaceae bacterium]